MEMAFMEHGLIQYVLPGEVLKDREDVKVKLELEVLLKVEYLKDKILYQIDLQEEHTIVLTLLREDGLMVCLRVVLLYGVLFVPFMEMELVVDGLLLHQNLIVLL
jgi:hypothetical protein